MMPPPNTIASDSFWEKVIPGFKVGGFARCFQATDLTTNKQVAVKVISKVGLKQKVINS